MQTITVNLTPDILRVVLATAQANGTTPQDVILSAIRADLDRAQGGGE